MSSLGDVILASSALSALQGRNEIDWLVHQDYADVLRGHPQIAELIAYDRNPKLIAWLRFSWALLGRRQYTHVYDLHGNIRSFWFRALCVVRGIPSSGISKSRAATFGRYIFKKWWPGRWHPPARTRASALAVGGEGNEKPDLRFLATQNQAALAELGSAPYFCVMPSSRWAGKEWPASHYGEVLHAICEKIPIRPVVLGRASDPNSVELVRHLEQRGISFFNGVGRWKLNEVAAVLARAEFYFGADTGLAHLAEAMGRPSWMLFIPGVPDLGFGPWQLGSRAISPSLWCRPCGKDGRYCHRIFKRHECMKALAAPDVSDAVLAQWTQWGRPLERRGP